MLELLLARNTIIALAIVGALIATAGSLWLGGKNGSEHPAARRVIRAGYAMTFASMALFVVAGFMSGR
jgi:hypothetical protein